MSIVLKSVDKSFIRGFAGRWTFNAKVKAAPWQQDFIFTGRSFYRVNSAGLLQDQRDVWDAVHNNDYLSVRPRTHI